MPMRVLGGQLKGRSFGQPDSRSVRPLSDKVRAAIFDIVGDPGGLTVLDAYAGSGAAGFEAASRGAALVEAIEFNAAVARTIVANARELGLDWGYVLHVLKLETWLAQPTHQPTATNRPHYGLIIADPPYANLDIELLERLAGLLGPGGVMVVSHTSKRLELPLTGVEQVKQRVYGDTALTFYRRAEA